MTDGTAEDEAQKPSAYTAPSSNSPTVHTYSLLDKHEYNWFTLNIKSSAKISTQIPRIIEGKPIEGSVEINIKSGMKSVTIAVTGEIISEQNVHFVFVEVSRELWSSKGSKQASSSKKSPNPQRHSWPFSLELPKTVEAETEDKTKRHFRLPATEFTAYWQYSIVYKVTATVKYSSFFRASDLLNTSCVYVPVIEPSSPSPLRRLAYEQSIPIPSPEMDPEGWHSLSPVTFEGRIFGERTASVTYTLSLAKPLSYTRGSAIPLHLTVTCSDSQALDLLSSPSAPLVRLRDGSHVNYDAGGSNQSGVYKKLSDMQAVHPMFFRDYFVPSNTAVWWTTPCGEDNKRTLQGEIHLRPHQKPSSHFGMYRRFYDVALLAPTVPAFSLADAKNMKDKLFQTIEVEVATAYARGPRPIAYSKPIFDAEQM
ncbi:hypothetical protein BDW22DRAFT_1486519 [Trametopsis cervina]|nr:hypothetical protein BDW22DRAFT_1486519 [Trametopsis cervina]